MTREEVAARGDGRIPYAAAAEEAWEEWDRERERRRSKITRAWAVARGEKGGKRERKKKEKIEKKDMEKEKKKRRKRIKREGKTTLVFDQFAVCIFMECLNFEVFGWKRLTVAIRFFPMLLSEH